MCDYHHAICTRRAKKSRPDSRERFRLLKQAAARRAVPSPKTYMGRLVELDGLTGQVVGHGLVRLEDGAEKELGVDSIASACKDYGAFLLKFKQARSVDAGETSEILGDSITAEEKALYKLCVKFVAFHPGKVTRLSHPTPKRKVFAMAGAPTRLFFKKTAYMAAVKKAKEKART